MGCREVVNLLCSQIILTSRKYILLSFSFSIVKSLLRWQEHGLCNESFYGECVRHINVRNAEHIGISSLTKNKVKSKGSTVSDHFLLCNHSLSFKNFNVLSKENKKFLLELKESLPIMRYKPSWNRNIRSSPLYLFHKVYFYSSFGELNSWILVRFKLLRYWLLLENVNLLE